MSRMLAALRHLEQRANAPFATNLADAAGNRLAFVFEPVDSGPAAESSPGDEFGPGDVELPRGPWPLTGLETIAPTGPRFRQVAQAECSDLVIPVAAPALELSPAATDAGIGRERVDRPERAGDDLFAAEEPYRPDWLPGDDAVAARPADSRPSGGPEYPEVPYVREYVGEAVWDMASFVLTVAEAPHKQWPAKSSVSDPTGSASASASQASLAADPIAADPIAAEPTAETPSNEPSAAAETAAAAPLLPTASVPLAAPTEAGPVPAARPAVSRQPLALPAADPDRETRYRMLCSRLLATHSKRDAACTVLMFVSSGSLGPYEFSLVDLARAATGSLAGKLLIVAADQRSELLPASLRSSGRGVSDVWLKKASWKDVVRDTTDPQIDVAGWGANQADLAAGPLSWREAAELYQVILVAGGSAVTPLVQRVAAACDAVVMVVGLGITGQEDALQATNLLAAAGAPLAGCVVMGAPA